MRRTHASSPIERASPSDVVTLATDRGPAPMNIGAVLIIDAASDLDFSTVRSILEGRLPRVRRLRQRLLKMPFMGGPARLRPGASPVPSRAAHLTGCIGGS